MLFLDNQWYRKVIPYNEIHITSTSEKKYKTITKLKQVKMAATTSKSLKDQ